MPFNTYTFVGFFIILLIVHHSLRNWRAQKANLLFSSYLFYAAWNPAYVILLFISTFADWVIAKKIYTSRTPASKKVYLLLSLCFNLGLLGYFKYGSFLLENSVSLLAQIGINFQPAALDIILPVGISFYTFQTLSYTLDIYRGKLKPGKSLLDYSLYVSFFPQLVAGPIVRAADFLPQCEQPRKASLDQFGWGLSLLTIGLFMKIIIADTIFAPVVDKVYLNPAQSGPIEIWAAIFSFSGQIFCDFSGYSTAAIGIALCLGFILPDNFRSPYAALGFKAFWQRWHMSLTTWLRDYLYISLGGNRGTALRTSINVMLTMLIGGLWHGASWLFVIWGGLHGLYLVIENLARNHLPRIKLSRLTKLLLIISTYVIVSLTWIFFRAENMNDVVTLFTNLFESNQQDRPPLLSALEINLAYVTSLILLSWQIYQRNSTIEGFFTRIHPIMRGIILMSLLLSIFLFASGDDRAFIYFQF